MNKKRTEFFEKLDDETKQNFEDNSSIVQEQILQVISEIKNILFSFFNLKKFLD